MLRRRCAFLTTDDLSDFVTYDHLAVPPMEARGWQVDFVPWRASAPWADYDLVVIRTPWDYQAAPEDFFRVLTEIAAATRLQNPLPVVRWNLDKTYLRDLRDAGVPIVPTLWRDGLSASGLADLFVELECEELVVKPAVGANADHTYRLRRSTLGDSGDDDAASRRAALHALKERRLLAQPFVPSVVEEGEWSLFMFSGEFSHAILKSPKAGDFRVQEEHGGHIRGVEAPPELAASARRALAAASEHLGLDHPLLYARIDLVRWPAASGGWALMELELIEPSLYFPFDSASPERFATAVDRAAVT